MDTKVVMHHGDTEAHKILILKFCPFTEHFHTECIKSSLHLVSHTSLKCTAGEKYKHKAAIGSSGHYGRHVKIVLEDHHLLLLICSQWQPDNPALRWRVKMRLIMWLRWHLKKVTLPILERPLSFSGPFILIKAASICSSLRDVPFTDRDWSLLALLN